jgi:hypothetical protein
MRTTTKAAESVMKEQKRWFFALEHTAKTSPEDIEEMSRLMNLLAHRYHMKWCQCIWREKDMLRLEK